MHIGNYFYFTYLPNVQALKAEEPKIPKVSKDYLAYVEFTGNGWGEVKNIITSGFTPSLTVYNDTIYALWRPTANSSASYLLSITPNGKIINNVSLHVINASYLIPVTNDIGIVVNSTPLLIHSLIMSFFYAYPFLNIRVTANYYIVNLTSGNIIRNFPEYDNISPFMILPSGKGSILASYIANDTTYLVLYSSLGKIISERTFKGYVFAEINGSYIILDNSSAIEHGCSQGICVVAWEHELRIYNYNWTLLYSYYFNVSRGAVVENPIIVNSSLEYTVSNYVTKVINQTLEEVIENISIEKVPIPLNVTTSSTTITETTTISNTLSKTTSTTNATIATTSSSKTISSTTNSKLIEITLIAIVIIVVIGAIAYLIERRK